MRHDGTDTLRKLTHYSTFAAEFVSSLFCGKKKMMLSICMDHRQVYLLIFWLIKSDCNCRNILIFLISQLPLIITCKMGDVG